MSEQTENQEVTAPQSDDEAASLAHLNAQVLKEQEQLAPASEPEAAAPAVPTLQNELAGLIGMAVALAGPILPSLPKIYTDETREAVAGAVATLCQKYGWLQDGIANGYGEEIAAAMVLLPVGIATYQGVSADLAAMKPKKPDQLTDKQFEMPPVGEGDTGQKTVIIGAPLPAEGEGNANG
jgi:hypothetical protein